MPLEDVLVRMPEMGNHEGATTLAVEPLTWEEEIRGRLCGVTVPTGLKLEGTAVFNH